MESCLLPVIHKMRTLEFSPSWMSDFFFLSFLSFLGPHPWHMEVPRVGGLIRAVAAGLRQSHSNVGSELHLQPTPQLMATPDPRIKPATSVPSRIC